MYKSQISTSSSFFGRFWAFGTAECYLLSLFCESTLGWVSWRFLTSRQHMKAKKTQVKKGAQTNWSKAVLAITALLDFGFLGATVLSRVVYHQWPTMYLTFQQMNIDRPCLAMPDSLAAFVQANQMTLSEQNQSSQNRDQNRSWASDYLGELDYVVRSVSKWYERILLKL